MAASLRELDWHPAPVAQLDRAPPSGGGGHRFESCRACSRRSPNCGSRIDPASPPVALRAPHVSPPPMSRIRDRRPLGSGRKCADQGQVFRWNGAGIRPPPASSPIGQRRRLAIGRRASSPKHLVRLGGLATGGPRARHRQRFDRPNRARHCLSTSMAAPTRGFDVHEEAIAAWCTANLTSRAIRHSASGRCRSGAPGSTPGEGSRPSSSRFPYPDAEFDLAFGVSLFTHLSGRCDRALPLGDRRASCLNPRRAGGC